MSRNRLQNRHDHPVAWGVIVAMAYMVYSKFQCLCTDCVNGGGSSILGITVLALWAGTVYTFIPILTVVSNCLNNLIGWHGLRLVQNLRPTGRTVVHVIVGICGGLMLFTLLEALRLKSLCMLEVRCEYEKGFPENVFNFVQDHGWALCRGYGMCYSLIRNSHWLVIALIAASVNHFIETTWCIAAKCDDDGSQLNVCSAHRAKPEIQRCVQTIVQQNINAVLTSFSTTLNLNPQAVDSLRRVSSHVARNP